MYPFTDTKPKIDPKACADGSFLTGIKVLKHKFVLKRVPGSAGEGIHQPNLTMYGVPYGVRKKMGGRQEPYKGRLRMIGCATLFLNGLPFQSSASRRYLTSWNRAFLA